MCQACALCPPPVCASSAVGKCSESDPHPVVEPAAPVFVDGKKFRTLRGPTIATEFKALVIDYIDQRYGKGAKLPETTAAE